MTNLPDILNQDLENKWEAFEKSCAQHKISLPQEPQALQVFQRVFVFSDFVAKNCTLYPALISDLIESGDLQRSYSQHHFSEKLKAVLINVKEVRLPSAIAALVHVRHWKATRNI